MYQGSICVILFILRGNHENITFTQIIGLVTNTSGLKGFTKQAVLTSVR